MSGSIQKILQNYFVHHPVNKAYLFGSVARDEDRQDSDIDILVELNYAAGGGYTSFFTMQQELSALFNRNVDLVSANGLSPHIKPIIDREKKLVYERKEITQILFV